MNGRIAWISGRKMEKRGSAFSLHLLCIHALQSCKSCVGSSGGVSGGVYVSACATCYIIMAVSARRSSNGCVYVAPTGTPVPLPFQQMTKWTWLSLAVEAHSPYPKAGEKGEIEQSCGQCPSRCTCTLDTAPESAPNGERAHEVDCSVCGPFPCCPIPVPHPQSVGQVVSLSSRR